MASELPSPAEMASPLHCSPGSVSETSYNDKSEKSPVSYDDSGSENEGFVSGEEEFERAPEGPIGEDGIVAGVKDSSELSIPEGVTPAEDFDDDEEGLGEFEGAVNARNVEEPVNGEENNVNPTPYAVAGLDEFGAEEEQEGVGVKGGESKSEEGIEEQRGEVSGTLNLKPAAEEVVEVEGVKFTREGDAVVDTIDVDVNGAVAAVGADVEKSENSEVREVEVPCVDLDNGFNKLEQADKEVSSNGSGDGSVKNVAENSVPVADVEDGADELDIGAKDKGKIFNGTNLIGETVESEHVSDKVVEAYVAENGSTKILEELAGDDGGGSAGSQNGNLAGHPSDETAEIVSIPKVDVSPVYQAKPLDDEEGDIEDSGSDGETERVIFESPEAAKKFLEQLEQGSDGSSLAGMEGVRDGLQTLNGQVETDSEEEVDTDEEGEGKGLFDSDALTALLRAATGSGSDNGGITITSQDGSRLFSVERPAGLGSSLPSAKPVPRSNRPSLFTSLAPRRDSDENLSEDDKRKLEKLQQLRVKFLRLVHRLGHSPEDAVAAQVLYRLTLVAGRQTSELFNLDSAKRKALELESGGRDDLDFSLNILVLGKTGVGKSATINSIFGEEKALIHAFETATPSVKEMIGTIDGIKIRVIDTPGLKASAMEQGDNRRVLASIKRFTKKCPPDIVLYVDRLDSHTRDLNDMPLLKSITASLGSSIWRNAIVTLTHAASAPPDGPSGSPLSYEVFVAQRSHVVQQSIGHAVGDLRLMSPSLMNPVSLVENHPSCRKNRDGQKVLPNGQTWRPQLLLLCYSMKILAEANSLSKPQDPFDHKKLFGFRVRSPPLPYLLSWLLQSRSHPKLSADQGGEIGDSDIDMADLSDSDIDDEEDEYDQLPPFKPLRKAQLAKLTKEQRKAYFEEYDYRVKLLQKKQWREELRRVKEMKKGRSVKDEYIAGEDAELENEGPAAVPVPLPDMVLPPSFDANNPAYRYRFLELTSQFLARPVLDTHGWDHDCGYDGVNVEQGLALAGRFPASIAVQLTKDKKEFNIHLDSSIAAKHGENGSTMAGFDVQNVGKQLAYILRGETKFNNLRKHKAAAGFSVTFLGENVVPGFKVEDQVALGKRLVLVGSTGTVRSQGDAAYGANLEVRLREADFPVGQDQSSLGLSLVKWRGDLALGANLQSQISVGRGSKVTVRAGLNNKMSGQLTVRTSSSDQVQIALMGLLPIVMAIYKTIRPGVSDNYTMY